MKIENCKIENFFRKGFSFLELMIVIAIIGIMTVAAFVSLHGAKESKSVEIAAREVAAAVREAQNNALTGKIMNLGEYPCQFSFKNSLPDTYEIEYKFHNGGGCSGTTAALYASYNLQDGVTFSGSPQTISFDIPHATNNIGAIPTGIIVSKGSSTYRVCVYSSGRVIETSAACPS